MSEARASDLPSERSQERRHGVRYLLRILGVTAHADYKLKYSGSFLGYFWSVGKPMALFTMMYFVYGHIFKLDTISAYYPTSLLIGIVCFYFFADATMLGMYSLVMKESLLRKLIFPRIVIPISTVITAAITFVINLVVVGAFIASDDIRPRLSWLLLIPLLLELLVFIVAVSLILATLFVRLRDLSQLWELVVQLFMFGSPIMYPVGYLPVWARKIVFLNPFTQVLQDARALILYPDVPRNKITVTQVFGTYGRLAPIGITIAILVIAVLFFRHEEPLLAERA